ncbi:MAG: hypothetical protein VKQ33_06420 [Candidatus Sericytochromatia bacterium]|nr:hypothetical protein [Candidatus Sericytochromatia bacterium]
MRLRSFHLGLTAAMLLVLPGCWWLGAGLRPIAGSRLGAWGLERLGVVNFTDATYQGVGPRVAGLFAQALAGALGAGRVVWVVTSAPDVGLLGVGQARRLGGAHRLDGLVTGRVLAHSVTAPQAEARVVVGVRLLDANRGSIIWSLTVAGRAGVPDARTPEAGLELAAARAAKELIDDLLAPPPDAGGLAGLAAHRGSR